MVVHHRQWTGRTPSVWNITDMPSGPTRYQPPPAPAPANWNLAEGSSSTLIVRYVDVADALHSETQERHTHANFGKPQLEGGDYYAVNGFTTPLPARTDWNYVGSAHFLSQQDEPALQEYHSVITVPTALPDAQPDAPSHSQTSSASPFSTSMSSLSMLGAQSPLPNLPTTDVQEGGCIDNHEDTSLQACFRCHLQGIQHQTSIVVARQHGRHGRMFLDGYGGRTSASAADAQLTPSARVEDEGEARTNGAGVSPHRRSCKRAPDKAPAGNRMESENDSRDEGALAPACVEDIPTSRSGPSIARASRGSVGSRTSSQNITGGRWERKGTHATERAEKKKTGKPPKKHCKLSFVRFDVMRRDFRLKHSHGNADDNEAALARAKEQGPFQS
ncbi:hypothetical protein BV25DRAFT_1837413 [Artomyces pyxidatus]|uniref:Uncharacterized protein n=1 Tax=Artomyces pyxidatus TaxID=48021 RepID=A0ACB8T612_9AGAM|nr:hypothetical protein BV25DRAFT_1837413 [Artomyces pyxidatus]